MRTQEEMRLIMAMAVQAVLNSSIGKSYNTGGQVDGYSVAIKDSNSTIDIKVNSSNSFHETSAVNTQLNINIDDLLSCKNGDESLHGIVKNGAIRMILIKGKFKSKFDELYSICLN